MTIEKQNRINMRYSDLLGGLIGLLIVTWLNLEENRARKNFKASYQRKQYLERCLGLPARGEKR